MLVPGSYSEATVLETDLLGGGCPKARNAVTVAKTILARENLPLYSSLATPAAAILKLLQKRGYTKLNKWFIASVVHEVE